MFWENIGVSEMSQQQKIADTKKPNPASEENTYLSPKIMCNICNKKVGHMKAHMKYNHEPKSEKDVANRATVNYCTICQKSVCKKEVHNRKVHGHVSTLEVVPCPHCSDWFPSNEVMNEHTSFHDVARDLRSKLSRNLGTRLYCKLCRYHCFAKTGTGHKKTTGVGSGEILPRGYLVMEHHMKSHGEKHLCNKCGKEYNSERQLIEHAEACGLVFQCDQCPVDFKQKSSLECHILGEHENQYRFDCEKCDRKFSTTKSLLNHARTHNKKEKKVCIECRKVLGDSQSLKIHMLSHSNPLSFQCTWKGCNKAFNFQYSLVDHTRTHTKEKPFKCNHCDQTFRKSSHLSRHKQVHTGVKPHLCQTCGKGFIQRSNMMVHSSNCK